MAGNRHSTASEQRVRAQLRHARSGRARLRWYAALATAALALGGAGAFSRVAMSGAANDAFANSVRGVGGAPALGPDPGLELDGGFVGIAATGTGRGYWVAAADGGVFTYGDARFAGSAAELPIAAPVVGIAAHPSGDGYWLAAADGGVFNYGRAGFHGAVTGEQWGSAALHAPITAIAAHPGGDGYWLLGADGGVFAYGDAEFHGSAATIEPAAPFVAITPTRSGGGYWLLGADGGVFAYGDARFYGAAIDGHLATGLAVPANGRGYQVARSDGSVVGFGGAPSYLAPDDPAANQHPVVAIAARRGGGAWLARGTIAPPTAPDISQHPFLVCTRAHESDTAGGYRAVSPGGLYRGAYQFLRSTWNTVAAAAGRPDLVGVDPAAAAPADQDQLALWLYQHAGAQPWGGRCAGR